MNDVIVPKGKYTDPRTITVCKFIFENKHLFTEGVKQSEVTALFNKAHNFTISSTTLYKICDMAGVKRPQRYNKTKPEEAIQILAKTLATLIEESGGTVPEELSNILQSTEFEPEEVESAPIQQFRPIIVESEPEKNESKKDDLFAVNED